MLRRDVAEGLQHECLHSFGLPLPPGRVPCNQDGEAAGDHLLDITDARALAWGTAMTVDAAQVAVDFPWHHRLVDVPGLEEAITSHRACADGTGVRRSGEWPP